MMEDMSMYFDERKKNVTVGIEFECYLYDRYKQELLHNEHLLNEVLGTLPREVTRDYYTYQLEIRTTPQDSPEKAMGEFRKNLLLCDKEFSNQDIRIIPMSWLGGGEMFNGLHVHFRSEKKNHFENTLFNMYPFMLALTDCFKFSPTRDNRRLSVRFSDSRHIAMPLLNEMIRSNRYSDVCLNRHRENTRHRLKKDFTMEVRSFDIPYNLDYMDNLIKLSYAVVASVKRNGKIFPERCNNSVTSLAHSIGMTRESIQFEKVGYNHVLDCYNVEVYRWICKRFGIKEIKVPYSLVDGGSMLDFVNSRGVNEYVGGNDEM